MIIKEMGVVMMIIQNAYPRWAQSLSVEQHKQMILVWHEMFEELDFGMVKAAVKAHCAYEKFPPSIAEILERVNYIKSGGESEMTGMEAWSIVRKALKNGLYHAKEEYDKLPRKVQSAIGNHNSLKAWAELELDELETVVQSQFIRSYSMKAEQIRKSESLPSDVKSLVDQAAGRLIK